ncbi:hypothetical protein AMS68_003448 [Peltaster fructicola]|uniref:Uncharacterized protein n=1 Tax=Peltaster fructicola TaxID=286661 RepID=A0A6H0XTD6_9PEZI|nr:hypothetical protein AMS68_003448 [Peltaster fructicola]
MLRYGYGEPLDVIVVVLAVLVFEVRILARWLLRSWQAQTPCLVVISCVHIVVLSVLKVGVLFYEQARMLRKGSIMLGLAAAAVGPLPI